MGCDAWRGVWGAEAMVSLVGVLQGVMHAVLWGDLVPVVR